MSQPVYDAIIVGAGPGGSASATYLAKAGKKVLVLEKEHFPRFHIGESLLPYNVKLFREMGVLGALQEAGFPIKYGAQFHLGNRSKRLKLVFKNGSFTRENTTFQVERAKFDHVLMKHARSCGAEVREGWTVRRFSQKGGETVKVEARGENEEATFEARFLIDASGRGNVTGNQEGIRVIHPGLKKLAVFGHFEGVALDSGTAGSDTVIIRLSNKWFWIIPVSAQKISVGCVLDQEEYASYRKPPPEVFAAMWQSSAEMRARMKDARLVNTIQTTSDFSYYNKRLVGPRLLRVGDAAGFMDPIFSAGVYLAMYSGKLGANVVLESLQTNDDGTKRLKRYEKEVFRAMRYYWILVESFYTTPFMELFMEPRHKHKIPEAVLAILAGELEGGWPVEIRRQAFLLLVQAQRFWPIVPRISFEEQPDGVIQTTEALMT